MEVQTQARSTLPRQVEELSADWLTEILGAVYPGAVVTSMATGTVIHGTATKVHLLLTYNEAGHKHRLPPTMWLKTGYEPFSAQPEMAAIYRSEAYFYRDLAASLKMGCPKAYAVHIDDKDESSFFLLEDLLARNVTFGHATKPVGPDQAALIFEVQANLHAKHWNRKPAKLEWLSDGGALYRIQEEIYSRANWDRCMALPRGVHVPAALKDWERSRDTMLKMLRHDMQNAHCVVHGDAHNGNTYFDPAGVGGYVDWQTVMWGYWAHDVADFMTTSMSIEDRRHAERDLLNHYLTCLKRFGAPAPSFEDAWLQYRRHAIYNTGWAVCWPEWQPDEVCAPNTERAYAAAVDLDSFGAWAA